MNLHQRAGLSENDGKPWETWESMGNPQIQKCIIIKTNNVPRSWRRIPH